MDGPKRFDQRTGLTVAAISANPRALGTLLTALFCALLLAAAPSAHSEEAAPAGGATGQTGAVTQLGADPTVRITRHRHCVSTKASFRPRYTGGGGLIATYLYVNGAKVAERRSAGSIRISAKRLARGANSFELISEFADGRAASVVGNLRRCGGR